MRFAVVSDIHSNLPALEAVAADLEQQRPDLVIVAGDFINRGPQPREVLALLSELGWPRLRGNHEDYVIEQARLAQEHVSTDSEIMKPSQWTAQQIAAHLPAIAGLPLTIDLQAPDDSRVLVVHASPRHNRDGIYSFTSDDELREMLGPNPAPLLCCGHTHQSLIRHVDDVMVVNVGATGLPFNGDWRAQYGMLSWQNGNWHAELRAIPYDRERTLRAFEATGFLVQGGPLARIIMEEVKSALPHLGPWYQMFAEQVRAGALSMAESVERYLEIPSDQIERF